MRYSTGLIVLALAAVTLSLGCAGVTEPVIPNSPPVISEYFPEDLLLEITVPGDSVAFSFTAADSDGDKLTCSFVLVGEQGEILEVFCHEPDFIFRPEAGGFYHIQGRAEDHSAYAARDWFVSAAELENDPPSIIRFAPVQDSIAVLGGSTLEFMMEVEDDHPEYLCCLWYAGDEPVNISGESFSMEYRFLEGGFFDITGVAWDGEYGDTLIWVVWVTGEADTIAPGRITDLTGRVGADPGTIRLWWTAPGDDGMDGCAYRYLIRSSDSYIVDEQDWLRASLVRSCLVPGLPGTREEVTVGEFEPATWCYISVRAVDFFGNMSELGNCMRLLAGGNGVFEGFIFDAAAGDPLGGIVVTVGTDFCVSMADGYYMIMNPDLSSELIVLRDEDEVGDRGDYYDAALPVFGSDWRYSNDLAMMPYFDLVSVLAGSYNENFFTFFRNMTYTTGLLDRPTIFWNWNHFPVTIYNPPFSWDGVDIQDLAKIAISSWNDLTGLELLVETTDQAAADVEIIYEVGPSETKHHVEPVSLNEDGTPAKKRIWIYPNNQLAPIQFRGQRIFAHELGHILQLGHSYDLGHLMVGGTAPITDVPSEDEINLIRTLYGLPTIFDATWYIDE